MLDPLTTGTPGKEGPLFVWLLRTAMLPLMPSGEGIPGLDPDQLDAYLRRFRAEVNGTTQLGVIVAAIVFVISPIFTIKVPLPSFLLSESLLDRHADKLCNSPLYLVKQAIFLLKMYAGFAWGIQDDVREALALPAYPEDPEAWRTA
ncbi:MAG: hypothetical protein EP330_21990 [Deltaproteobacteria bacterium]|nr:MAG: hypothetical protein EP330_21990 [Deltaproteobacteria bacterium]